MKTREITLFGGAYDGQRIDINEDTTKVIVGDKKEEYFVIEAYPLATTKDVISTPSAFSNVLNELFDVYHRTRNGDEMQEAKFALKERIKELRPGYALYIPAIVYFFVPILLEPSRPSIGIAYAVLFIYGYFMGFAKIKDYIRKLG